MHVVITSIFPPTQGMRQLAEGLAHRGGTLWVMGDRKGPAHYDLPATRFLDISAQRRLRFQMAGKLPEGHYARKNLGYLLAMEQGADFLLETDDDNLPLPNYWRKPAPWLNARIIAGQGWCNVYRAFSDAEIWPRGYPLDLVVCSFAAKVGQEDGLQAVECLVQQGLADENPDVDAIYRLTRKLPVSFSAGAPVALANGCWCPFNSQNTTWFKPAFPLLYLPSHCSFRMTDIWRSFVAQRCLWAMESHLGFIEATMRQERNPHDPLRDFEQEIDGYRHNRAMTEKLAALDLRSGRDLACVGDNLLACYETLASSGYLPAAELDLVAAWVADLRQLAVDG